MGAGMPPFFIAYPYLNLYVKLNQYGVCDPYLLHVPRIHGDEPETTVCEVSSRVLAQVHSRVYGEHAVGKGRILHTD